MTDEHKKAMTVIEHRDTTMMSPVVAAGLEVLRNDPSPEALEKLLAVQERWEAAEARRAYAVALVDLKRDLPAYITRDKLVDFGTSKDRTTYRHATLAGIMDQIGGALTQHGFTVSWDTADAPNGQIRVTARLLHSRGHSETTTLVAAPDNSGGKNAIQAQGSAVTYLQRYTALALLGLATGDMPDADDPPKQDPDVVDLVRNQEVAVKLSKMGLKIGDAEEHLGRKLDQWTTADIDELRKWAKK